MLSDDQFDDLVEKIYEAALNPVDWNLVVDQLTKGFDAIGASVYTPFFYRSGMEPIWSTNADPEFIAAYATRYATDDILAKALWKHVPVKTLVYSWDDIISRRDLEAWGGYKDLLSPRGVAQGVGLLVEAEDHRAGQLMIYCPDWEPKRVDAAKKVFSRIAGHMSRAMRVHWHLTAARLVADASRLSMDMFQSGVVWLSKTGDVLYTNEWMKRILEEGDGVEISGGKLTFFNRRSMDDVALALDRVSHNQEMSFNINRPSGKPAMTMTVFPLPIQASALRIPQAIAIGFISEGTVGSKSRLEAVRSIYHLTPAETRILDILLRGKGTHDVAAEIGTSENTVRTQIKSLLSKCGVNRQADLIRLVAMLPQVERV